jgi:hypothetical protein
MPATDRTGVLEALNYFRTFPERSGLEQIGVPRDSLLVLWLLNISPNSPVVSRFRLFSPGLPVRGDRRLDEFAPLAHVSSFQSWLRLRDQNK